MSDKPPHGGKRPNAGRKAPASPTVTRSVSMPESVWTALDEARGAESRGKYLARLLAR